MYHGASKRVEEQSQMKTTIKNESHQGSVKNGDDYIRLDAAATSTAHVDSKMDLNHLKQKLVLVQSVKSEPALFVKEEILEDGSQEGNEKQCVQGTSAYTNSEYKICNMSLGDLPNVKQELDDMHIGPTVLQYMDIHYVINKNLSAVTEDNTIVDDCNKATPGCGLKKESLEDKFRGSLTPQKATMNVQIAYNTLQSLQFAAHKGHLESICMVHLMRLVIFQCEMCDAVYAEKQRLLRHLGSVHGSRPQTSVFVKFKKTYKKLRAAANKTIPRKYSGQKMKEDDNCEVHMNSCLGQQEDLLDHDLHRQRTAKSSSFKCDSTFHKPLLLSVRSKLQKRSSRKISTMTSSAVAGTSDQKNDLTAKIKRKPFECNIYNSRYSSKAAKFGGSVKPYPCDTCDARFARSYHLAIHMRIHTVEKPYRCDMCDARFIHNSVLTRHMRIHTRELPYRCETCDARFTQSSGLSRHMRVVHMDKSPFICDTCYKRFSFESQLTLHMRVHTGEKPFLCDTCDTRFTHSGSLTSHMRIHTGEKPYRCDMCDARFTQNSRLTNHRRRVHMGEQPYRCDRCNAKFTKSRGLTTHMRVVHMVKNHFLCNTCDTKFANESQVIRHMRVHTGEKPFLCDTCDARFTHSGGLTSHMRIHTGEKRYRCDTCDARFTQNTGLAIHMRIHTGEKPYRCDTCDARFTQNVGLTRHVRIHTGEKPYCCDTCDARFMRRGTLTSHMRIHTGKKPYCCDTCDARFIRRGTLTRHIRVVHTDETGVTG